jgi:primary-amine oxidase
MLLMEEYDSAAELVRADPRWQQAMQRRGITDLAKVYLDVWAPGELEHPGARARASCA